MLKEKTYQFPQYNELNNLIIIDKTEKPTKISPEIEIYTDGSVIEQKNNKLTMASSFTFKFNGQYIQDYYFRHHELNTIYQAELYAIKQAIDWFINSSFNSVLILSDSHSSIDALKIIFPRNSIIKEIYQQLIANPTKQIYIQWTKAHVGTEGNERADLLAKNAATYNSYNEQISLPILISAIKKFFYNKIISDWQAYWSGSTKGRQTYEILNKDNPDFISPGTIIPNFLSGHGSFPTFLKKLGKRKNDKCLCNKGRGTVVHYLRQKMSTNATSLCF